MTNATIFWMVTIVLALFISYTNERHVWWHKPKLYALAHAMLDTILIFLAVILIMFCILLIKYWYFA